MQPNPYQAPVTSTASPTREFVFSEEGVQVVHSLARWMGLLGVVYYLGGAAMVLGGLVLVTNLGGGGVAVLPVLVGFGLAGALFFMAGTWLREAGNQFARGVGGDDVGTIGAGFRTLRRYLILFGVFEGLQLAAALSAFAS